jgi:hypothetical protein
VHDGEHARDGAADYVESQILQPFEGGRNLGTPGPFAPQFESPASSSPALRVTRPISSFVLGFGVCVRLLLSAFH